MAFKMCHHHEFILRVGLVWFITSACDYKLKAKHSETLGAGHIKTWALDTPTCNMLPCEKVVQIQWW